MNIILGKFYNLYFIFRVCLEETVRHCEEPLVKCPHADGCDLFLQEREIKAVNIKNIKNLYFVNFC